MDWQTLLVPSTPLLEIFLRGTLVYLGVFVLLRIVLKRELGSVGISDLIIIVFIADAAQNAMADDYRAVPDGLILVAVLIFWSFALDALAHRFPTFRRLVKPAPLLLIKDGELQRRNMRREFLTEEELPSQLRLQGVEDIAKVRKAFMEPDGRVSVVQ